MESNRHPLGWRFLFVPLALALAPVPRAEVRDAHVTSTLPEFSVVDPSAPAVTEANLLASERFWPYQTALAAPWQSLAAGALGVLIRVDPANLARIDFGRDGLREVPVGKTDLLERANAIRLGAADKQAPNFLFALGPRLVDPTSTGAKAYPFDRAAEHRAFLCVFADPWRKEFGALVSELEALRRPDVLMILFPQGHRGNADVAGQLRAMKWTEPFVYDHLAEPYTKSLLSAGTPVPAVLLQTADGRVLLETRWSRAAAGRLAKALE